MCFPISPCSLCGSCPSVFHMVPLNLGLHSPTNSVVFFFLCQYIYLTISCQNLCAFPLPKCTQVPAQLGIISTNKALSEAKGCPGCARNAGLALGCSDYLHVFAQHWRQDHYLFRKSFHIPDLKKHHKLLHKNMCKWYDGNRLDFTAKFLKQHLQLYICAFKRFYCCTAVANKK